MEKLEFNSKIINYGKIPFIFDEQDIKNETMYFRSTWDFIKSNNYTPITEAFFYHLPLEFRSNKALVDTKVHMLFPEMYPCIPGWHLDDVPRTRSDGQPDHANPIYKSRHCSMIIGDASRTEYLTGNIKLKDVKLNQIAYKEWNNKVQAYVNFKKAEVYKVRSGEIIEFDWQTFHHGVPATHRGFRWFGRVTIDSQLEPRNEIRKQANVYTTTDISW